MKKLKSRKQKKLVAKKKGNKGIDFKSIQKSFTSLDPQNIGSWPAIVKAALILMIFVVVGALAYSIPIKDKIDEISASEKQQETLLKEFEEKEAKARNLQIYKDQIEQMKVSFTQLLEQLPKDTKIPDLVEDINIRGIRSDIQFNDISVNNEITKELFIEQPITIQSSGEYHKFGNFVSSIASLPRIITMHDFTITNAKANDYNSMPELDLTIEANTYRSKDTAKTKTKDK